jgi:predicted metalloprotease
MRLDELPTSDRIEDRRRLPAGRAGLGIGTVLILGLIGWALGIDPRALIGGAEILSGSGQQQTEAGPTGTPTDQMGHFVSTILGSTEVEWKDVFAQAGRTYQPPTLVMFSGATQSGLWVRPSRHGSFFTVRSTRKSISTLASFRTSSAAFGLATSVAKPVSSHRLM